MARVKGVPSPSRVQVSMRVRAKAVYVHGGALHTDKGGGYVYGLCSWRG